MYYMTENMNPLAGLIAAFDAEKARIEADQMTRFTDEERKAIREDTQRLGFDRTCERYGEDTVSAAWLPED